MLDHFLHLLFLELFWFCFFGFLGAGFCHPPVMKMKMKTEEEFVDEHSESSFDRNFILLNQNVATILMCPHKIITNVEFTQKPTFNM